jgi:hypothetical protein
MTIRPFCFFAEENIMYMKDKRSGDLVEVLEISALIDPNASSVMGRFHAGEELPEKQSFAKNTLLFPSGEALPRCWGDPNYKG